ncbi:hypothetical protein MMC07_005891, partial [Pseudocyphellaria aurata]|nr:hypothetical protein [Pseudocyphellaria aurata]
MSESLEDRLRNHAKAFDGLLELIPAKFYYGEDTTDQWQRKKQTKEQARNAKLAKLDPENSKSAKDVMDENARKRKREDEDHSEVEGIVPEKPMQTPKPARKQAKKPKREKTTAANEAEGSNPSENITESTADRDVLRDRRSKKKDKRDARVAKRKSQEARREARKPQVALEEVEKINEPSDIDDPNGDIDHIDIEGIDEPQNLQQSSTATPSPAPQSPIFDNSTVQSGTSSISSIVPLSKDERPKTRLDKTKVHKVDPEELRARLQLRIDFLRSARNADGLDGKPARNRQELIEARRQKEEQRRAHKKELRQKAREEEQARNARGSPLLAASSQPNVLLPRQSSPANNFSFNRIAFADGQKASAELTTILAAPKPKGPQDPLTALRATQSKESRLAALDPSTRADIAEKDLWLNARKRAHGERVRDDTSLLKKTLKRKEKAKKKSEREWAERLEGVDKGKALRAQRRDENVRRRKEETAAGGKRGSGNKPKAKPQARPGFE